MTAPAITARSRSPGCTGISSTSSGSSSSPFSISGDGRGIMEHPSAAHEGQHHPISLYLKVWGYLYLLSAMSYMVDYLHVQRIVRWTLIILRSEEHTSELQSLMRI